MDTKSTGFQCPTDLRQLLEMQAVFNHRSLTKQIIHLLEKAVEREQIEQRAAIEAAMQSRSSEGTA